MEKRDTALIAGASSGIGRAYAAEFARRGYDLIITGRGKDLLRNIAAELAARHSVKVNAVIAELSNDRDLEALSRKAGKTKSLTVLVNNAGFGAMRDFLGEGYAAQEALLKIHSLAPVK
ncbi:MAG TPA: SDR family NAD(P)-dependent oxidoreductase, partial [Spirochaetota bacterium]|nr:SDR family NAD(P)-dependent oxidoreductase [Spirochaetota bacterium]